MSTTTAPAPLRSPVDIENERLRLNQAKLNLETAGVLTVRMEDTIQAQVRAILQTDKAVVADSRIADSVLDALIWLQDPNAPAPSERWMRLYRETFNP